MIYESPEKQTNKKDKEIDNNFRAPLINHVRNQLFFPPKALKLTPEVIYHDVCIIMLLIRSVFTPEEP